VTGPAFATSIEVADTFGAVLLALLKKVPLLTDAEKLVVALIESDGHLGLNRPLLSAPVTKLHRLPALAPVNRTCADAPGR